MPQADIEINAVASSNEDLPINALVQLSNNDIGDEASYDWSIIDQPVGPADVLSAANIENPTLTPLKEDTYLIQLIVDQGLPGESIDRKLFRVRRFKTDAALVAVSESIEGTQGAWALPQNETLAKVLNHIYDGNVVVAQAGGPITTGAAVQLDETVTIKAGLPGAERVPRANLINATDANIATKVVGIAIGKPDGDPTVLVNDMVLVRTTGLLDLSHAGTPAIGDNVFIDDSGVLALVQGTNRRKVGTVIDDTAGAWRAFLSTLTEEATGLTPHAIGGASHTASSLAALNLLVTGGNLDFDSAARVPSGPAGGGLSGNYPNPTVNSVDPTQLQATDAALATFTGASATLVAGMTLTPPAGTYLVWFNGSLEHTSVNESIFTFIYVAGVNQFISNRFWRRGGSAGDIQTTFLNMGLVTVNGAETVEGRWLTSAATARMFQRVLQLVKVA